MAEGWERVELYPRAEDEEYMTFTTTTVYHSLTLYAGYPKDIFFSSLLLHHYHLVKRNRRAMTTEIPDLMEAVLCNIQPGRCKL